MKRTMKKLAVALVVLLCALPSFAAEPQGELTAGIGYEWDRVNEKLVHNSTQTGFRFVLEDDLDFGGKVHLSAKGYWDWKQKDGKLALDQLWVSGYYREFDYALGRQVISWGTADGFNPTNYFGRLNSNALISGDLSGEPIWSGQAVYYGPNWSLTGVVIPVFTPQPIDGQMRQMMLAKGPEGAMILKAIEDAKKPKGFGKNSEWALRAEAQLGGFDLQASYFSGFEPLPGLEMVLGLIPEMPELGPVPIGVEGVYRRQHFVGLATTGTIGPVGVWGEMSYGGPGEFAKSTNPVEVGRLPLSINKKYLQAVVGGDYTLDIGKGLLVQAQYIYRGQGSLFAPYVQPGEEVKAAHYLYGRLGYDFNAEHSVDIMALHSITEKNGLIRPAYTYRFANSLQAELSIIGFYGGGDVSSMSSQGRLAVKYQF